ncbi:MAG: hypothetical protein ACLVDB_08510 [Anaeromassilibacillus sp.]
MLRTFYMAERKLKISGDGKILVHAWRRESQAGNGISDVAAEDQAPARRYKKTWAIHYSIYQADEQERKRRYTAEKAGNRTLNLHISEALMTAN